MTDSPNQRLCKGCKEWIDARAASCYLCGEEAPERNVALVNAIHTERVNANILAQAGAAQRERQVTSRIPQRPSGTGPTQLYNVSGARELAAHYKSQLQQAGFGE